MDRLNDDQRYALSQLRELTNGGDDDAAINILESVGWDVQQAANMIFGGAGPEPPAPTSSAPKPPLETFEIDDSRQSLSEPSYAAPARHYERHTHPITSTLFLLARPIISLLAVPIHILANVMRFIFGLLRIPIPQFHLRFVGLNLYRSVGSSRSTSRTLGQADHGPERWIRELEEETGAVCVGRTRNTRTSASGAASSAVDAGPSNLTARTPGVASVVDDLLDDGRKVLPDFMLGSYEEMLRVCKKDARIGCVILVSEEHDDVPAFKRFTLTDPTFVKLLYDNNIVVWGGDVKDREAWSASEKLQATTFPFVAFLALQPRRSPSGTSSSHNNSSPTLTILSRHQGKSVPSSGPTAAATLVTYLERQVLPRVVPFLDILKAAERERQLERQLRQDQDRAYKEAAKRDKERIEAMMRKEKEEAEQRKRQEQEAKKERERQEMEQKERLRKEEERILWRKWMRRRLEEDSSRDGNGPLRIAIRLPNGSRVVRRFTPDTSLTTLYAYVASQLIPAHPPEEENLHTLPAGLTGGPLESCIEAEIATLDRPEVERWWGFRIVNAYPRREIEWMVDVKLGDVGCLKGGGQVVVEMPSLDTSQPTSRERTSGGGSDDDDDDGYDTEE